LYLFCCCGMALSSTRAESFCMIGMGNFEIRKW
jgi:hypothetical protein